MRAAVIAELLHRRPFQPFRLFILEDTSYDVPHPELMTLGNTVAMLNVPAEDAPPPAR